MVALTTAQFDAIDVGIQAVIGLLTFCAVVISLCQLHREKKNRINDQKRYQASRVSAWYADETNRSNRPVDNRFVWQAVTLQNSSEAPVYNAVIMCVGVSGAGPTSRGEDNPPGYSCWTGIGTIPPGTWNAWLPTHGSGMGVKTAPEIAFSDANGTSWVRRGNGNLEEIESDPVKFYNLTLPVSWSGCSRPV